MRRKILRYGCAALLVLLMAGSPAAALEDAEALFRKGVAAYGAGDFKESARAFQALADRGIQNGKLYYNLGNAYLKLEDLGHAILWYERALRRMPRDPDLRFNYAYALSLARDAGEPGEASFRRILFFWRYLLSPEQFQWVALLLNALLWIVLFPRRGRRSTRMKTLGAAMLFLTSVAVLTAGYNAYEAAAVREGVILAEEAPVRSGLTEQATELFRLHAGARVRIEREREGYYRVRYSRDKFGWIPRDAVGRI